MNDSCLQVQAAGSVSQLAGTHGYNSVNGIASVTPELFIIILALYLYINIAGAYLE